MSQFIQGLIILFAIIVNLGVSGKLLFISWFESGVSPALSAFLLFWFVLNLALAWAAFGPQAKA